MDIIRVYPVKGNLKKQQNLFAIYVMVKKKKTKINEDMKSAKSEPFSVSSGTSSSSSSVETLPKVFDTISVRDNDGGWTDEYKKIMNAMSIPSVQ